MIFQIDRTVVFGSLFGAEHAPKSDAPHETFKLWHALLMLASSLILEVRIRRAIMTTIFVVPCALYADDILLKILGGLELGVVHSFLANS